MKKIYFLLALLLHSLHIWAQFANCQPDQLQSGIQELDTLQCDTIACYPFKCDTLDAVHIYALPSPFDGVIHITGDPQKDYEILIVKYRTQVVYDTCATLYPWAGGDFLLYYDFGDSAYLVIMGTEGDQVQVVAKPDTSQPHHQLPPPIVLLDTLCGAITAIFEPIQEKSYMYYDLRTMWIDPKPVKKEEREAGVMYKEVKL